MTTKKMTVHKALCELKTLDARIQKSIQQGTFVFAGKTVCGTQVCPPFWAYRNSRSIYFRSSVGRARHF